MLKNLISHTVRDYFRMFHWLLWAVFFYTQAIIFASFGMDFFPQIQTVSWKLGHLTSAAFVGYWIDRSVFRNRITTDSHPLHEIRRAIIIGCTMLGVSLGL